MLLSFIIILCFLIKTNLAAQLGTLVCSSTSNVEPTLIEIFQTVIPSSLDDVLFDERKKLYEKIISSNGDLSYHLNASINSLHELGNQQIHLRSIISNGEYNIKFDNELSFNDIFLIQKSYYTLNLFCSSSASHLMGSYVKDLICKCVSSTNLKENDINKNIPRSIVDDLTADNSLWCLTKQCSSKDEKKGFCKITVDPLRPSCVWVSSDNVPDNAISYNLHTPMLNNYTHGLLYLSDLLNPELDNKNQVILKSIVQNIGKILDFCTLYVPKYLAYIILGYLIFINAETVSTSTFFRYLIASTLGTLLGLFFALYFAYRQLKNVTTSTVPFASIFVNVIIPVVSIYYSKYMIDNLKESLIKATIEFWNYGILGYEHSGKVYFLLCSVTSVFLTWYYSLFAPKTFTGNGLVLLIKGFAALIILQSSSNIEILAFSFIIVYFWPLFEFVMHRIHLSYNASKTNYTIKKSNAEYEAETKACTEKELAKLRAYISKDPKGIKEVERLKLHTPYNDVSTLLNRFIHGDFFQPDRHDFYYPNEWRENEEKSFITKYSGIIANICIFSILVIGGFVFLDTYLEE